jgi:hypothetical protein
MDDAYMRQYIKDRNAKYPNKSPLAIQQSLFHPVMESVHKSFAEHYPLTLSPDIVWLCIAQGFATHVNLNAEALRSRFVDHEGKKLIMIQRDFFVKGSPDNDWQGAFSEFSDKLAEYLGKKRDLVVSNFSTTGPIEKATSEIVLMDAMKSYFKYVCRTCCGIPSITLLGVKEDWDNVCARAEALAEYDLSWWTKSLLPVLRNIADSFGGTVNPDFWNSIYKLGGSSGGPYCTGWINTLFPYIENYKHDPVKNSSAEEWNKGARMGGGPTLDAYPSGLSKCPFKWQYHDITFDMEFLGGFVGTNQDENTFALTPAIGWGINDTGVSANGPINPEQDW